MRRSELDLTEKLAGLVSQDLLVAGVVADSQQSGTSSLLNLTIVYVRCGLQPLINQVAMASA